VAEIEATDIDEMALSSARANSKLDKTEISIGFSNRMPHDFELTFDLVIANILEGPLRELAHPLAQAVRPGGVLLLSGFTRLQIPSVKVAFERVGLIAEGESTLEEWCLLKLKQPILRS
jgi:ribosomal protein L11 methyltransferase